MLDPRDKRFYQIQKKERNQLSQKEINEYIIYCKKMLLYVKDKKTKKGWNKLILEMESIC